MNTNFKGAVLACSLALCGLTASAVPANITPRPYTQPDGTVVMLSLRGDEAFHYLQDKDGHIVAADAQGWYRIVGDDGAITSLLPMEYSLRSDADREAVMQLHPERAFEALRSRRGNMLRAAQMRAPRTRAKVVSEPKWDNADGHDLRAIPTEGERPVLVVLVNFADLKWSYCDDPQAEMSAMLNEPGYTAHHCTGSAFDFFQASSNGLYRPRFDVYGPVNLPGGYAAYGRNDSFGNDSNPAQMVVDAITLLDSSVDFSQYDTNGDGLVDNVYIFYAGHGENEGASANTIWPHSWDLHYALEKLPEFDGVKFDHYATSNELTYTQLDGDKTVTGIGTFCHEFGHVLGLPDIYSAAYTADCTPGEFTIMDHGSYNNVGRTPPVYSAYERYAMEWQKPIDITESEDLGMFPLVDGGNVYRITVDPTHPTEYFLFENRQQHSWDTYIPEHGMLAWHIDYNSSIWDQNAVNDNPNHQYIDIVEADGEWSESSLDGDPFPGSEYVGQFNATSPAAFKNWNGRASSLPLSDIVETPSGVIFFKAGDGSAPDSPLKVNTPDLRLTRATASSLSLSWPKVQGATGYYLNLKCNRQDEDWGTYASADVPGYEFRSLGDVSSVEIDGLDPAMTYIASLYAASPLNISQPAQSQCATVDADFSAIVPNLEVIPDRTSALLRWPAIEGADYYLATVATRSIAETSQPEQVGWDYSVVPDDWGFSGIFDSGAGNYGLSAPSVLLAEDDSNLNTSVYDADISSISLWARTSNPQAKVTLTVYAPTATGGYALLGTIDGISSKEGGDRYTFSAIPAGVRQLTLIYNFTGARTNIYIDDVELRFADRVTDTSVAGYGGMRVDGTSLNAQGLTEGQTYVAYINAVGPAGSTQPSRAISFTAAQNTSAPSVAIESGTGYTFAGGVVRSSEPVDIYTVAGQPVALRAVGAVQLPERGIYVVRTARGASKIAW